MKCKCTLYINIISKKKKINKKMNNTFVFRYTVYVETARERVVARAGAASGGCTENNVPISLLKQ